MANETEIQPALTAEEWSDRALSEEDESGHGTCIDAQGTTSVLTVTPVVPEPDGGWRAGMGKRQRIDIERRHALAALALHGQPFGFTHADVNELNWLANTLADALPGVDEPSAAAECLRSIATRIAALLPPHD